MLNFIGWALLLWCLWTVERVGMNATSLWLSVLAIGLLLLSFAVKVGTSALLWHRIGRVINRGR